MAGVLFPLCKDDSGVGHLSLVRSQEGVGATRQGALALFTDVIFFNGGEAKVRGKLLNFDLKSVAMSPLSA